MFSAAPTPQVTASILKALEIIKQEPQIRTTLWENTNYLRKRLKEEGKRIKIDGINARKLAIAAITVVYPCLLYTSRCV